MKFKITHLLAAVSTLLTAQAKAQATPIVLEPTSKWHVVYDDDSCRLARIFGADETRVVFTLEQHSPINQLHLSIYGKPVRPLTLSRQGITAAFGPAEKLFPVKNALPGTTGVEKEPILIFGAIDLLNRNFGPDNDFEPRLPPTPEQISKIHQFTVAKGKAELVLQTGPLNKALQVLGKCTSDLVQSWGLDPERQAKLASRPQPITNPGTWLKSMDYPWQAKLKGESASIQFRLMVDSTGTPTVCKVQSATRSPDFIDLTCKLLMKRARFAPARDALGEPADSYYTNSVNWVTSAS